MKIFKYLSYILIILLLSFVLPRIIPGSPLTLSDSDMYILNSKLPEETFNMYKEYYAPDKPIAHQFILYIKNLAALDLGYSFYYKLPVSKLIFGRMLWTIFLAITSIIISAYIGIKLGLKTAINDKWRFKKITLLGFTSLQAIPAFIAAVLIQLILSYKLHLLPSSGAYTPGIEFFTMEFYKDAFIHSILPLGTLVLIEIPSVFLLTYKVSFRVKNANYVKMAYYLNLDKIAISEKYILANSLPEILSKLNIQFLYAISGALFVEAVFSYPGIGTLLRVSASSNDYTLLQGILLFIGIYSIIINMIFEALIRKFNPRLNYD